jgi:nucleoside 2-deoxyribosyltransferase
MRVYVASPLGFSEAGRDFYNEKLLPLLSSCGCELLDPWALTPQARTDAVLQMPYGQERRDAWRKLNTEIGGNNAAAIKSADMLFAVLDGVDVDSGTAAEIGYAFGLGKPILGYRGDFRLAADNDGATVNLQVEYFILQSGGNIIVAVDQIEAALAAFDGRL